MVGLGSEFCALLSQESQLCRMPPASVAALKPWAQYPFPDSFQKSFLTANSQILPSTWHLMPI